MTRELARLILEIMCTRFNKICSMTEHVHVEQLMTVEELLRLVNSESNHHVEMD